MTMRPVFIGNFEHDTRQTDLDRLFSKYGRVDRIDIKSGYAFVYFEDERDAEAAIKGLDSMPFGYSRRKLSVEWSKQGERGPRGRDGSSSGANTKPTKTLFVINFDPTRTRVRDIERHFEPYGKLLNVRIKKNFAFVQFETLEEATKALESTNMTKILDRVVSVEYAFRDDDDGRHASPNGPSDSPGYRKGRHRPSPDYSRPRSPVYDRYGGYEKRRNLDHDHYRNRSRSPDHDRYRNRSRSPDHDRYRR